MSKAFAEEPDMQAGSSSKPSASFATKRTPVQPLTHYLLLVATAGFVAAYGFLAFFPHAALDIIGWLGLMEPERVQAKYHNLLLAAGYMYAISVIVLGTEWALNRHGISALSFAPRPLERAEPGWYAPACMAATALSAATVPLFLLRFKLNLEWLYAEDGPMEYGTVAAYLAAAAILLRCLHQGARKPLHRPARIFLGTLATVFLLVALEEISWGQRIFGLETPPALQEINAQKELNVHNLFNHHFNAAYFVIGITLLAGAVVTILARLRFPGLGALAYAPHPFLLLLAAEISAMSFHFELDELVEPISGALVVLYALQLRNLLRARTAGGELVPPPGIEPGTSRSTI